MARVRRFRLKFGVYQPRAGAGGAYIRTPAWILALHKHCIINVINDGDEKCFLYAILAHLHSKSPSPHFIESKERYQPYLSQLNTEGFSFPFQLKDVP